MTEKSLLARHLLWREARRSDSVVRQHRQRSLAGLAGEMIEVGCGDRANLVGLGGNLLCPSPSPRPGPRRCHR